MNCSAPLRIDKGSQAVNHTIGCSDRTIWNHIWTTVTIQISYETESSSFPASFHVRSSHSDLYN